VSNPGVKFGAPYVRQVIKKCEGRSVVSGETNIRLLCVVRVDMEKPWSVENAVLVTSAESYALTWALNREVRLQLLRHD
jgi:hypothetical protein